MRVAMLCWYPWEPGVLPGGVAAATYYLTRGLVKIPDLDLHLVVCQYDVTRDTTVERDGTTIHFLRDNWRFTQAMDRLPQRLKMAGAIRKIRPDLVHAQGLGVPAAGALDAKVPRALTVHGLPWKEPIEAPSWITRIGDRLRHRDNLRQAVKFSDVFVISDYVAVSLPPEGSYRQFRVNNPVGDEMFEIENRPELPHVIVVGGLRKRKDPMTSVRVMECVLREVPEATMHLIGMPSGTDLDQQVADYIDSHGMADRVKVLGMVPNETLYEEYAKASVLLMPSVEESAPVAIGEACAVGFPQVGSNGGGIPYMIRDGETGYVRPVGDVEGLARRVIEVLTDDELRRRLAANARELGRSEFAVDPIARKTFEAYETILRG